MKPASNSPDSVEQRIKAEAFRLGFSLCGITTSEPPAEYDRYDHWLADGCHAGMDYLNSNRHRALRRDPTQLVPGAKSILSLGWSYPLRNFNTAVDQKQAWVAGYASGEDYHLLLQRKIEELADYIKKEIDITMEFKGFTDSAPILEREIAARAGLGWIGKNSNLISPVVGSSFLLAELFIDQSLDPDPLFQKDYCGSCTRCLQACPTGCIRSDRTIDSSNCLSYLTIENKGMIPEDIHPLIGNWLFGCDICQMVCPWNQKKILQTNMPDLINWSVDQVIELLFLSPIGFLDLYNNSSITRTKIKGMQRNALIFLENQADLSTLPRLRQFLDNTSDPDLAESARWVITQIENQY